MAANTGGGPEGGDLNRIAAPQEIRDFVRRQSWEAGAYIHIAELPADLVSAIAAETSTVRISGETMAKQCRHHPDVPDTVYVGMQDVINLAGLIAKDRDRSIVLMQHGDRLIYAALKTTLSYQAVYLSSVRYATQQDIIRARRRWTILLDTLN